MTTNKAELTEQEDAFHMNNVRLANKVFGGFSEQTRYKYTAELVNKLSAHFKKVDPDALEAFAEEIG